MAVLVPEYRNIQESYVDCSAQNHIYFMEVSVVPVLIKTEFPSI